VTPVVTGLTLRINGGEISKAAHKQAVQKQVKAGATKQKKMSKPVVEVQVRAVGVTAAAAQFS
jgi:hypothetical protein